MRDDVFEHDKKTYNDVLCGRSKHKAANRSTVIEDLVSYGKSLGDKHLKYFDELTKELVQQPDTDLLKPYERAVDLAQKNSEFEIEVRHIETHVKHHRKTFARLGRGESNSAEYNQLAHSFIDGLSGLQGMLSAKDPLLIAASFAYSLSAKFAFCVAFDALCDIKAAAAPEGSVCVARGFQELMAIPSVVPRLLGSKRMAL